MYRMYRVVAIGLFILFLPAGVGRAVEFVTVDEVGRIHTFGPKVINIVTDQNKPLIANLDPERVEGGVKYQGLPPVTIKVEGTIPANKLASGIYVRFEATLDARRRGTEDVGELTVFTPEENTVFGASSSNLADLPGGDFGGEDQGGKRPKPKPFVAGVYFITGRLQGARGGSLTVAYPEGRGVQTVRVRLAKDAAVKIESNDLKFASRGDKIHVKGKGLKLPKFFATEVTITMSQGEEKKPPRRGPPKKPDEVAGADGPDKPFGADAGAEDASGEEPAAEPVKGRVIRIN